MCFRLVPKSMTLNDLEGEMAVILRYSTESSSFGGRLRENGRRQPWTFCERNVAKNLVFSDTSHNRALHEWRCICCNA